MPSKVQKKERRRSPNNKTFFLLLEPNIEGGLNLALVDAEGLVKKKVRVKEGRLRAEGAALLATTFCLKTIDSLEMLAGIAVKGRGGSFTNLRLTISVANTLAWLFDLNVFTVQNEKQLLQTKARTRFLVPHYDKDPNITKPRL